MPAIVSSLALTALFALSLGCVDERDSETGRSLEAYAVPLRSDVELARAVATLCATAVERERPVLVEFSAAWCSDCRKLHGMKQSPALAEELEAWPALTINVGRFDRHRALLAALGVESIAHWAVLAPTDCASPIGRWPRVAQRTLEVQSGAERHLSAEDLARWLEGLRDS